MAHRGLPDEDSGLFLAGWRVSFVVRMNRGAELRETPGCREYVIGMRLGAGFDEQVQSPFKPADFKPTCRASGKMAGDAPLSKARELALTVSQQFAAAGVRGDAPGHLLYD